MAKVLISLVGGRPLPNVLVALHLKPDHHYLVTSQDSLNEGGDYAKTIAALPQHLHPVEQFPVKPYDLQETIVAFQTISTRHREDELLIHTTSGPKTMAFGAYEVARQLYDNGQTVDVGYLARTELIWVFKNKREPVEISLEHYFASYGWQVQTRNLTDDDKLKLSELTTLFLKDPFVTFRLLPILRRSDKGKGKRTCHAARTLAKDEYELLQQIEAIHIVSRVHQEGKGSKWTINSDKDAHLLLTGDWLEYYVYTVAASLVNDWGKPMFEECSWGVEAKDRKGEIDFAGLLGGQLVIASCKTEDNIKRTWFEEVRAKAERLGKGMCSTMLISTVPRSARNDQDLQDYERWANDCQVVLVMAEDLPQLGAIFKKIVFYHPDATPKHIRVYPRI